MKLDLKQAGAVALMTLAGTAVWAATVKLGLPHSYADPLAFLLLGTALGAARSYFAPATPPAPPGGAP